MEIKVCGNTSLSQIKELSEIGIDYVGLIFYDSSPRAFLNELEAYEIKKLKIKKTGVFVNEALPAILEKIDSYGLDLVQLHGDETPSFCTQVSDYIQVIKAFRIKENQEDIDWMLKDYEESCDYYLFDKASKGLYGGTGEKFNWDILNNSNIGKPFFLSGGIDIEDIQLLNKFSHPFFYGIDINTKFETSPGIKDTNKVREFVNRLNKQVK